MRFNDYHKNVCATLKLDRDASLDIRPFMLRLHSRGITVNAAVPITREEIERRKRVADLATPLPP